MLILDQFEEYFLYRSREPTPERFADELARCINQSDLPANFLIAIREDAYASLGELFKGRIANVYGNYLHIEYLDRALGGAGYPGARSRRLQRAPRGQRADRDPGRISIEAVLDQVRASRDAGASRSGQAGDA